MGPSTGQGQAERRKRRMMAYMSAFRRAAGDRRGIAMLIGIMVLAALFFMALPFAVYMRQQHSSATQALEMTRARFGQSGAVAHAKNVLYEGYEANRASTRCGRCHGRHADGHPSQFPLDNPDVDTAWEFHVTLRTRITGAQYLPPARRPDLQGRGRPGLAQRRRRRDRGRLHPGGGPRRGNQEWMSYSCHRSDDGRPPTGRPRGHRDNPAAPPAFVRPTAAAHLAGSIVSFFPASSLWSLDIQDQQALINVNTRAVPGHPQPASGLHRASQAIPRAPAASPRPASSTSPGDRRATGLKLLLLVPAAPTRDATDAVREPGHGQEHLRRWGRLVRERPAMPSLRAAEFDRLRPVPGPSPRRTRRAVSAEHTGVPTIRGRARRGRRGTRPTVHGATSPAIAGSPSARSCGSSGDSAGRRTHLYRTGC